MTAFLAHRSRRQLARQGVFLFILLYATIVAVLLARSPDAWSPLLVAHVLSIPTIPLLLFLSRDDRRLFTLFVAAFAARIVAAVIHHAVMFGVYAGVADALSYHQAGELVAQAIRSGLPLTTRPIPGTGFIDLLTGVVYLVTGANIVSGYLVFSMFNFWGAFFFYRAFSMIMVNEDKRRYAALVFFLPSLLFWPSALGKDAWLVLSLGLAAYGAARLLAHGARGVPLLVLGLTGALLVRPHIALLISLSLCFTYVIGAQRRASILSPLGKTIGAGVVVLLLVGTFVQFRNYMHVESGGLEFFDQTLENLDKNSSYGDSLFENRGGRSLVDVPVSVVTVLFRPWPFETRSPLMLLAALEGVMLLGLVVVSARQFVPAVVAIRRNPYVTLCGIAVLLFAFIFSNVGNFGLLVRQRTQVLPFLLVLLALRPPAKARRQPVVTPSTATDGVLVGR